MKYAAIMILQMQLRPFFLMFAGTSTIELCEPEI